jgi:hypothetical protein
MSIPEFIGRHGHVPHGINVLYYSQSRMDKVKKGENVMEKRTWKLELSGTEMET